MRVLVAMSGGVDSSVAAALLVNAGHEVEGATLKLWGGVGDSGCCSVGDVTDARRVADELSIVHHVFNFTELFESSVVTPYVDAHLAGATPNPCAECNRHVKFGALLARARRLGFDALATGHHARVVAEPGGNVSLRRGKDVAKDQSYVLSMLTKAELSELLLPIGELDKQTVRSIARSIGLRTADKPDSQDVCFIASRSKGDGRGQFLRERADLHAGTVTDRDGRPLGRVDAVELVTIGQRRGLGAFGPERHYVLDVDTSARRVVVGRREELFTSTIRLGNRTAVDGEIAPGRDVLVQTSAHGGAVPAVTSPNGVETLVPLRRVAPGQLVALYEADRVIGSGVAVS